MSNIGLSQTSITGTPVQPVSNAGATSNFLTSYDSTTGLFTRAQPAFTDISGVAVTGQIPNLPASKITTGQIALAQGGTNADLSATGGANQFLKQTSVGGTITVAGIVSADIASGVVTWDKLGNAAGALTLANGTNATTFNQTSAVNWKFANTTAATSGGVTASSPIIQLGSRIYTSGTDTGVTWNLQSVPNPTTAQSYAVTNASENSTSDVVLTIGTHTLVLLNVVTFTNLTTFTWMNGQTCYVTAVAATTITVRDATAHGTQGSTPITGTITQQPVSQLVFSTTGVPIATDTFGRTAAEQRLMLPLCGGFANGGSGMGSFAFTGQADFTGYGPILTTGGFAIYVSAGASSSNAWLTLFDRATAASNHLPNALASLVYGNNSAGNNAVYLQGVAANYSVALVGSNTNNVTNPCVHLGNIGNLTATAGAQIGIGMGVPTGQGAPILAFAPTSGTATFNAAEIRYTVNQTGGASGAIQGLKIRAVETAVGAGGNKPLDVFAGTTGVTEIYSIDNTGAQTSYTANGAKWIYGSASELLTLSTGGTTTDTAANLLPVDALIESVVCRVTTAITTASNFSVGDVNQASRFSTTNAVTLGTTSVGINQWDPTVVTANLGPQQSVAAKVRITTNVNPGAGVVRITVFYRQFVAPTS